MWYPLRALVEGLGIVAREPGVVASASFGFLKKALGLEPRSVRLLTARIAADDDGKFFVIFSQRHPELKSPEFVRLTLHYYAKVLFLLGTHLSQVPAVRLMGVRTADLLRGMVSRFLETGISLDSDLLHLAGIDDVTSMAAAPPASPKTAIVATLWFKSIFSRGITTDLVRVRYEQHIVFSVVALLHAALAEIDEPDVAVLNNALRHMNRDYVSGVSYCSLQSMAETPNAAFLSAFIGTGEGGASAGETP